jgi:cytochrome c oxidase subunit II
MYENPALAASNFVKGVDTAFVVIFAISFFFLIAITATMIYFLFRYNKKRNPIATQIEGSTKLEIIWTVVPIILVLGMFYYGWAGWRPMTKIPEDAFTITAEARMWNFSFVYPNGKRDKDLVVPQNQPIVLDLKALDVIHSLYIPAFRVKEDMVPGKESRMWFIPQRVGEFDLFCAEYCGLNHSYMISTVKVLSDSAFQAWYADTAKVVLADVADPTKAGFDLLQNTGCFACHSVDGRKLVGPTYKGLWGSSVTVLTPQGEKEVLVDEDYVNRSIFYPDAEIVKGYARGQMLPYKGILSNEEVDLIIEYLKTLSN